VTAASNGRARAAPSAVLEPFDLGAAVEAARTEANSAPFVFTWKGQRYALPPFDDWPVSAMDKISEGDFGPGLAELLGEKSYRRLLADGLTLGALNKLVDQAARGSGAGDLGNGQRRTAPASTQT
jgi:hypothetical protein